MYRPGLRARRVIFQFLAFTGALFLLSAAHADSCPQPGHSDAAWWQGKWTPEKRFEGVERTAEYIPVRDGTRIATYRYLPRGLPEGEKIPTILIITPYVSEIEYSWLGERFGPGRGEGKSLHERFAEYGYATIYMDARGAAASFGKKKSIFTPDVVRDGSDVVDWIVAQPWSNGNVGATGVSAVGMTANWLTIAHNPALKAIAPRFTTFDIFYDVHPGGLLMNRFVGDIDRTIKLMDSNQLWKGAESMWQRVLTWFMVNGVHPVDSDPEGELLAQAVSEHANNEYHASDIAAVTYRDERLPGSAMEATLDTQSPFSHIEAIRNSGTAVYVIAGWFDGAFSRGMTNYFVNLQDERHKMIIGPWEHGGRHFSSPFVEDVRKSDWDQVAEMVRFFDFHLRGVDTGIDDEARVHYYTVGSGRWNSTASWPPQGAQSQKWYLGPAGSLRQDVPQAEESVSYQVDPTASTGVYSRYGKHLTGPGRAQYPDRRRKDEKLLVYQSAPLEAAMEVTGHPAITLHLSSDASDGAFLVYLEDVDPSGEVRNVTDGVLRGLFRKTSEATPPYLQPLPYRTYTRADAEPIIPGEVMELTFDLFPISYQFARGHSVRIALSGADADNFPSTPPDVRPTWQVYHGGSARASHIVLPVVGTGAESAVTSSCVR